MLVRAAMERWLTRLERRLGRYAIPDLSLIVVGGMALVFALSLVQPETRDLLTLDWRAVTDGQLWRLLTFVFLPPQTSLILALLALYMLWIMGSALDQNWGAFRFNAFYLVGMLGTALAAAITGKAEGNTWLNVSVFLAFAAMFPETEFRLFFLIPVRVKWLGLLTVVGLLVPLAAGSWSLRAAILAGVANTLLFVSHRLPALLTRAPSRRSLGPSRQSGGLEVPSRPAARSCAICGVSEADGADIRVCNCEKCGGKLRTLCLPHAKNH